MRPRGINCNRCRSTVKHRLQITHLRATPHDANSPGNAFASVRSSVSKLSVNQPNTGAKSLRASSRPL